MEIVLMENPSHKLLLMHKANAKKWVDLKGCGLKCGVIRKFTDEKFGIIYPFT